MDEKFSYGEPVKANVGEGPELGFVVGGPEMHGGEQKYDVSVRGQVRQMAFTADAGQNPPGLFFTRGKM